MKRTYDQFDPSAISRSVANSVQPKLTVSEPNDLQEEEANRMADSVMRQPEEEEELLMPERNLASPWIQRQSEAASQQMTDRVITRADSQSWLQRETGPTGGESGTVTEAEPSVNEADSGSGGDEFSGWIAGIVRDQLSDPTLRGHLNSLGTLLEELAEENTRTTTGQPGDAGIRLVALQVSEAFSQTAREILADPALTVLRSDIVRIVGQNPEVALALVLCAGVVAGLADVSLAGSPSIDLGEGFNLGITFDLGTVQDPQYNNLAASIRYTYEQLSVSLGGGVRQQQAETEGEENQIIGSGTGEVRIGDRTNYIRATVLLDSEGDFTVRGQLSSGAEIWGADQFLFTADLSYSSATDVTAFRTGARYRISLGSDQSLSVGTSLDLSSETGLGATGFLEYNNDWLFLRTDLNTTGIPVSRSIDADLGVGAQLSLSIELP